MKGTLEMFKQKYLICLLMLVCVPLFLMDYNGVSKFFIAETGIDFLKLKPNFTNLPASVNFSLGANRKPIKLVLNETNSILKNYIPITELSSFKHEKNTSILSTGKRSGKHVFGINENLQQLIRTSIENKNQDYCSVSTTKHFLTIPPNPGGRLGNHMFMFASALGIASRIHYQLIIPTNHPLVKNFDLKYVSKSVPKNLIKLHESAWKKMIASNNMSWLCHNLTLQGLLQNYRYFKDIASTVKNSLVFRSKIRETAEEFVASKSPTKAIKVGIHVRRRDFLSKRSFEEGRVVAEMSYISKAMNYFRKEFENVHFFVCSDDITWCQNNIHSSNVTFSHFPQAIIDMAVLSLCDHMIITAGTFGWWGGWLSGGTVVYLSDYPKPGSHLEKIIPKETYYPKKWIGMSNVDN